MPLKKNRSAYAGSSTGAKKKKKGQRDSVSKDGKHIKRKVTKSSGISQSKNTRDKNNSSGMQSSILNATREKNNSSGLQSAIHIHVDPAHAMRVKTSSSNLQTALQINVAPLSQKTGKSKFADQPGSGRKSGRKRKNSQRIEL